MQMPMPVITRIVEAEDLVPQDLNYICALIDNKGGIEYTRSKAQERIDKAKRLLGIFPECQARQALYTVADFVVSRKL